jgi:16S rRNA (uracil1498-N3)-methyltransferase
MSAPRFFVAAQEVALTVGATIALPVRVAHHATRVLRVRDGEPIVLFDGLGGEYEATLASTGRSVQAQVHRHVAVERESPVAITLVQALVASDVMDAIVRKAVELGVGTLQPVLAERSQRGPAERLERRTERWRQVAIAACEQCGRNRVPAVEAPLALVDWIGAQRNADAIAVLDPGASVSLASVATGVRTVVIGPEGGLTPAELAAAAAAHARTVHLGVRVLRADTAAVVALATLNAVVGDAR